MHATFKSIDKFYQNCVSFTTLYLVKTDTRKLFVIMIILLKNETKRFITGP